MGDERVKLSTEEALGLLDVREGRVHTFRDANGILVGADWDEPQVRDLVAKHGAELSGPAARAMNHGVVVVEGPGRWLFVETKTGACDAFEKAREEVTGC